MTVKVTQPSINLREEITQIPRNLGDMAFRNSRTTLDYELIETRVLEEYTSDLYFNNIFTDDYSSFKLVIHWLGVEGGSNTREIYLRYTNQSGSMYENDYYWVMNFEGDSGNIDQAGTNDTEGKLWEDAWSDDSGGVHGEINFYNVSAPYVNGFSTDRGSNYRPFCHFTLLGYDEGQLYGFSEGSIRRNTDGAASSFGGFRLYLSNYDRFRPQSYMSLYGLRV